MPKSELIANDGDRRIIVELIPGSLYYQLMPQRFSAVDGEWVDERRIAEYRHEDQVNLFIADTLRGPSVIHSARKSR